MTMHAPSIASSWTDFRIETMKSLWLSGKSAAQIAQELSAGLTRNAVTSKLRRLGLVPRPAGFPTATVLPFPVEAIAAPQPAVAPERQHAKPLPLIASSDASALAVLALESHMCKWPFGDPAKDGFSFCTARARRGPYCHEHAQLAYEPPRDKGPSSAAELARSLRRHL